MIPRKMSVVERFPGRSGVQAGVPQQVRNNDFAVEDLIAVGLQLPAAPQGMAVGHQVATDVSGIHDQDQDDDDGRRRQQ
jgi:hypothetical protein